MRKLTVASAMMFLSTAPVLAQSAGCSCQAPLPAGSVLGQVSRVAGQVLISESDGLAPAAASSPLFDGSRLVVGPASSASLGLGGCSMSVSENSEVEIFDGGGNMCVRVRSMPTTAAIGGGAGFWRKWGPLFGFNAFQAAFAYTAEQISGGSEPMSR